MARRRVSWVLLRPVRLCTSWWRHIGSRECCFVLFRGEEEKYIMVRLHVKTVKKEEKRRYAENFILVARHAFSSKKPLCLTRGVEITSVSIA